MSVENGISIVSDKSTSEESVPIELNPEEILDCEIGSLIAEIEFETKSLHAVLNDKIEKKGVFLKHLEKRLEFIKWTNKKFNLLFSEMPKRVMQREIFYCELGQNIGYEQCGNRPVVVLQNDTGNAFAKVTTVAPITTHGKSQLVNENGIHYIIEIKDGKEVKRKLNYYEVIIQLESHSGKEIVGTVDTGQLRTVSYKRLSKRPLGKITPENYIEIISAVSRNLSVYEKKIDKNKNT